jgi:small subunit ribosomal protein S18
VEARIDYWDPTSLTPFLDRQGRIRGRRLTRLSRRRQRHLAKAVKVARELGLLAYPPTPGR